MAKKKAKPAALRSPAVEPYTLTELKKLPDFMVNTRFFNALQKQGLIVGRLMIVRTEEGAMAITVPGDESYARMVNEMLTRAYGPPVRLRAVFEELDEKDNPIISQRVMLTDGVTCKTVVSRRLVETAIELGYADIVQWYASLQEKEGILNNIIGVDEKGRVVAIVANLFPPE